MKLQRLQELSKDAVTQCNKVERVSVLSAEELQRVIGGQTIEVEGHAHYNYTSCACECGAVG